MKVSVCIPTYNRPDLLDEAIQSCLTQTRLPDQIIIGDDSKNDESMLLVKDIQEKNPGIDIRYLKHSPSLGQLANVNKLIDAATGDKFVLLHDDDLLLPPAIEIMLNCFEKHPGTNVVFGKQKVISQDGVINEQEGENANRDYLRTAEYEGSKISSVEVGITQQFPNDCYMIDMDIVKKLKYGDKAVVGNAGDFDFGFRLGLCGYKFYFVNEYTAKYRITEGSVARSGTDSGYQAFKLIAGVDYKPKTNINYQEAVLTRKAPVAIVQALQRGKVQDAFDIYFGKYHRKKILTPGGIKRFLILMKYVLLKKV